MANSIPRLNANQQAWLLVKLSDKTTLPKLYKNNNTPKIAWLYETTLLDQEKKEGPLLINITSGPLLEDFCAQPEQWTAFLIYTTNPVTEEKLLSHLRNLLTVRIDDDTAVLNYLDPKVASFFFNMPEYQLGQWLGPMDLFSWWGGDFIANENNQQKLYCINNPLVLEKRPLLEEKPRLTPEQIQLLENCQEQQYIWQWSTAVNIPFLQAWQYYQEGIRLAFTNDQLETYIKLRAQYAEKPLPDYPRNLTAAQRLQLFKDYWTAEIIS